MKTLLALACLFLTTTVPAWGQSPYGPAPPQGPWPGTYPAPSDVVPNLNGYWYLNGNPNAVCQIRQEWSGQRAEFINEHGSVAWGTIQGNQVWIPDWTDGVHQGLMGTVAGNRIVWPDGSYWSR